MKPFNSSSLLAVSLAGLAALTIPRSTATTNGARLRCAFQKLEGQVKHEGLWLNSTVENSNGERFRVVATESGRVTGMPLAACRTYEHVLNSQPSHSR